MQTLFVVTISLWASLFTTEALAQTVSPAMLEQFKQLPRAEQERLAKQYGIDINQLNGSTSNVQQAEVEKLQPFDQTKQAKLAEEKKLKADEKEEEQKLKRFGMAMFDAEISTFAPVSNAPVPDSYLLGPDDTLFVQLYGKQTENHELKVDRDGNINLPGVGPVSVAGLKFAAARELINNRIQQASIGVNAAVSMGQLRTINIMIAGEAKNPGMYAVSALTTVTQALFVAGGVSDIGSLRHIVVNRSGKRVAEFDLYDLLLKGENSKDVNLQHGDVVFIRPAMALVTVDGEVQRPAIYELVANDTVQSALNMAGGTKPSAFVSKTRINRVQQGQSVLINLDLSKKSNLNQSLQAGDSVYVPAVAARLQHQVVIAGAVERPGFYAWQQGLQFHDVVDNIWTDLLLTTDLDYAIVLRQINNQGDIEVIQFNVATAIADANGMVKQPLTLEARDVVVLFHYGNETYKRAALNDYLRKQIESELTLLNENALLSGDVAATVFKRLQQENTAIEASRYTEFDAVLEAEKNTYALLENKLNNMLSQLYSDSSYIELSKHLSRRELVFPILKKLQQQSSTQQDLAIVSISGDVKVPGEYPLARNASIKGLIQAASGLNVSAYLPRAELSRYLGQASNSNKILQQNLNVALDGVLVGSADNITLQSRDRLNVFETPAWSETRLVAIEGEVRFPGTYQVLKGETLAQLIKRAGGFTDEAFLFGAIFTREGIKQREKEQTLLLLEQLKADIATKALSTQGGSATPDALTLVNQVAELEPVGRLVVDVASIIAGNNSFDIALEDKDKLFIPRSNNSISIIGEVQHSGSHRFDRTKSVEDYLRLAGGSRKRADEDRVYVIRADGSVMLPSSSSWFAVNRNQLTPGDTIVMPLDSEYKDSLSTWAIVTQIFYQSAVALAALNSF
ncbi:sugar transporter [Rheinheimera salexigens]|uniref:Sugar transporter n=1 Tax=Rheinheimera salexigens TaxID=1628148 RepID=A0A1E7QA06_9GAMM|nr:sugar transporter [Rheinheimera salexigens]